MGREFSYSTIVCVLLLLVQPRSAESEPANVAGHSLCISIPQILTALALSPRLPRSTALQAASGRYGEEIVVPGGRVSATNPTGKVVAPGAPLRRVPASS